MSKKEIITLVIVGMLMFSVSLGFVFYKSFKVENHVNNEADKSLKVGEYLLAYGTYRAIEKEYDQDLGKYIEKEVVLTLSKEKVTINGESNSYLVKDNSLYVNGVMMYKVEANNRFSMLAGGGVEFNYEKE